MYASAFQKNLMGNIRSFFKTTMDTLDIVQNHAEHVVDMFYTSCAGVQKRYLEVFKEWLDESKKIRDEFRRMTESYLDSMEKMLEGKDR